MSFNIGNIKIKNQVVLAPMAGISNPAFIKICEKKGVGYAVTELLSSEAIVRKNKKTFEMLKGLNKIKIPVGVQIFGSDPKTMAEAASILTKKYKVKIIDINMGCPVPKVAIKNEAGSALLKNPSKIKDIVSYVVQAVNVPVTVKIRSGWDEKSINAVEVAKICEEAGAKAIAIHARTKTQGYSGKANWEIIKQVKQNVSIPVIGNGDIKSCFDAQKMLEETNCDAVMIGRGALGNPWLIKECVEYIEKKEIPPLVTNLEKIQMMRTHYKLLLEDKNEKMANLEIRSQILYYLKGMPKNKEIKNKICQSKSREEIIKIINDYENLIHRIEIEGETNDKII